MSCPRCKSSNMGKDQNEFDCCLACGFVDYDANLPRVIPELDDMFRPSILVLPYVGDSVNLQGLKLRISIKQKLSKRTVYVAQCSFCKWPTRMEETRQERKNRRVVTVFKCRRRGHSFEIVSDTIGTYRGWK